MKLQDAYAAESNALGTWKVIGYSMPASSQFNYTEGTSLTITCTSGTANEEKTACLDTKDSEGKVTAAGVVGSSKNEEAWTASNIAQLNDCTAGKNWIIGAEVSVAGTSTTNAGSVVYTPSVNGAGCTALTPNFTKIGTH